MAAAKRLAAGGFTATAAAGAIGWLADGGIAFVAFFFAGVAGLLATCLVPGGPGRN
jgi:hypothetical protein